MWDEVLFGKNFPQSKGPINYINISLINFDCVGKWQWGMQRKPTYGACVELIIHKSCVFVFFFLCSYEETNNKQTYLRIFDIATGTFKFIHTLLIIWRYVTIMIFFPVLNNNLFFFLFYPLTEFSYH